MLFFLQCICHQSLAESLHYPLQRAIRMQKAMGRTIHIIFNGLSKDSEKAIKTMTSVNSIEPPPLPEMWDTPN